MSSPALAENTNAAPAAAEPVVAAKKAKTSVEGKASPTKRESEADRTTRIARRPRVQPAG